jgi:DNA (cytosine-5)-methyltransferase 1
MLFGLKTVGLFAGIGGIEIGLERAGHRSIMLCESNPAACAVLSNHFPAAEIIENIHCVEELPSCDLVAAGFPCQDLSQAGRTAGIDGKNSNLISKVFDLLHRSRRKPTWLLLENVPFMLHLRSGQAMRFIIDRLDHLGWSWAYRTIDTRAFGLPQRRNRVIFLASTTEDPRPYLLGQDAGPYSERNHPAHACGFYWTEGNKGLGWAVDAIPPLKGGSGVAIPSPPAIWFPRRRRFDLPSIEDAERLQGFSAGWTEAAVVARHGAAERWKLVGNAVSVPLAEWLGSRLATSVFYDESRDTQLLNDRTWPAAAWGRNGDRYRSSATAYPIQADYIPLARFLSSATRMLSRRAASGFLSRLEASTLRVRPAFIEDLRHYVTSNDLEAPDARRSCCQQANGCHERTGQSTGESASLGVASKRPEVSRSSAPATESAP